MGDRPITQDRIGAARVALHSAKTALELAEQEQSACPCGEHKAMVEKARKALDAARAEWERIDGQALVVAGFGAAAEPTPERVVERPTVSMADLGRGLHPRIPARAYHRRELGVVSKSALDLVHRSPLHYKAWADGAPEEETPALRFGRAFHCAMLEPDLFPTAFASEPEFGDCRKTENRQRRDAWRAEHAGAEIVSADMLTAIEGMREAVQAHPLASKIIQGGDAELTVTWTDAQTGLHCKCRADYYVRRLGMVADLKSTDDASRDSFRRDIVRYRYHVQDALYRAGFAAVGETVQHFVFVAVEKEPPHAIAVYTLDAEGIGHGYSHARRDIDRLAACVKSDTWPGYEAGIQVLELPPWAA